MRLLTRQLSFKWDFVVTNGNMGFNPQNVNKKQSIGKSRRTELHTLNSPKTDRY
jgi:hypothetical protein